MCNQNPPCSLDSHVRPRHSPYHNQANTCLALKQHSLAAPDSPLRRPRTESLVEERHSRTDLRCVCSGVAPTKKGRLSGTRLSCIQRPGTRRRQLRDGMAVQDKGTLGQSSARTGFWAHSRHRTGCILVGLL